MERTIHGPPKKKYVRSLRASQDSIPDIGSPNSSDVSSPISLPSVKMDDLRTPDSQFSLDFSIKSPLSVKSKSELTDMLDISTRSPPLMMVQREPSSADGTGQISADPQPDPGSQASNNLFNGDNRDDFEIGLPMKKMKGMKSNGVNLERTSDKELVSSFKDDLGSLRMSDMSGHELQYRTDSPHGTMIEMHDRPSSVSHNISPVPHANKSSSESHISHPGMPGYSQLRSISQGHGGLDLNQSGLSSLQKGNLPDDVFENSNVKTSGSELPQVSPQLPSSTTTSDDNGPGKLGLQQMYPHLRFGDPKLRQPSPMLPGYQGAMLNAPGLQRVSPGEPGPHSDYDLHMFLQQEAMGGFLHPFPGAPLLPFSRPGMLNPNTGLPMMSMPSNQPSSTLPAPPTTRGGDLGPRGMVPGGSMDDSSLASSTGNGGGVHPDSYSPRPRSYDMSLKVPSVQKPQGGRIPFGVDSVMHKQGDSFAGALPHDNLDLMNSKSPDGNGGLLPHGLSSSDSHRSLSAQLLPDSGYSGQHWQGGLKLAGMSDAQTHNLLRKDPVSSGPYPYLPQNLDAHPGTYHGLPGDQSHGSPQPSRLHGGRDSKLGSSSSDSMGAISAPTSSSSTKIFSQLDSTRCQVCNDNASGFHCGAYVCEACKKFFIRCQKNDSKTLLCPKNKDCVITKETRTQCQYCRYQKCLKIGMYKPGPGQNADISPDISGIPCKVCGAPSSGYHFGAITCEGCKGFFRRTVKERDSYSYQCVKDGNCIINMATRNMCKYCRYKKCLEAGMTPEGSRIGRQPNAVKHATMLELQELQKHNAVAPKPFMKDDEQEDIKPLLSQLPSAPIEIPQEYVDCQASLLDALKCLDSIHKRAPDVNYLLDTNCNYKQIWKAMMDQFGTCAHCTLMFAKRVPGFRALPIEDQIALVQNAVYQIVLTVLSLDYCEDTCRYNYFNFTREEEALIMTHFPEFTVLPKQFIHFGQTFKNMALDKAETAHFCALLLLCSEHVKANKELGTLQEKVFMSLQYYCQDKYGTETYRHGELLTRLGELRRANLQHHQAVFQLKKTRKDLEFPQLYTEMFLND